MAKEFVNLRGSHRTELEECYPNHVINTWQGHSKKVAEKNYLQITDGHWESATTQATLGGNSSANQDASEKRKSAHQKNP